jgi:hypothetical protein
LAYSGIDDSRTTLAAAGESRTTLSFQVSECRNAGAVARKHLELLAGRVDRSTLAKLRLLVGELVDRAAPDVGPGVIEVSVTVSKGGVHAVVRDGAREEPRVLDWARFLVDRMADRSGVGDGVWFELDRAGRDAKR